MPFGNGAPHRALAFAALVLAACGGSVPPPRPERPAAAAEALGAGPGVAYVRESEEQRRGIGVPPALPRSGVVDRVPGVLRSLRSAPGVGPAGPPASLPVPGNSQSRLSALPASPLANPPGGFAPWRP